MGFVSAKVVPLQTILSTAALDCHWSISSSTETGFLIACFRGNLIRGQTHAEYY